MAEVSIAVYTDKELSGMSENRRRINNLTNKEWCEEWDRKRLAIRRKFAHQIAEIEIKKGLR